MERNTDMKLTTKDLFELAKIYWDVSVDPSDPENEIPEWEELTPGQQALEAESVHAVAEELQRRGWRTEKFSDIDPRTSAYLSATEIVPRVWQRIEDVPTDIPVTDVDEDRWENREGIWGIVDSSDGSFDQYWGELNECAPFTEVIDPPSYAGPWNRWDDVPEGIHYVPSEKTAFTLVYVNRNGVRMLLDDGEEVNSKSSDETVQSWAPFTRVVR